MGGCCVRGQKYPQFGPCIHTPVSGPAWDKGKCLPWCQVSHLVALSSDLLVTSEPHRGGAATSCSSPLRKGLSMNRLK